MKDEEDETANGVGPQPSTSADEGQQPNKQSQVENADCDFSQEIEKLQLTLQEMMHCTSSPSTSLDSSGTDKGFPARRLVRVPCEGFSSRSSHSDSGNSSARDVPLCSLPFTVYGGASTGSISTCRYCEKA
ncbi:unnamed protein product [Caenorhabditis auriculariae]|uniref:Uncharacterized protein n=1 Tax=Caenorhabditis auriculariae TaxID=2777116 RepID=A0A8S1HUM5_9PELO|nr:unnamed protein product [Caenorhabditis auriculariae]